MISLDQNNLVVSLSLNVTLPFKKLFFQGYLTFFELKTNPIFYCFAWVIIF